MKKSTVNFRRINVSLMSPVAIQTCAERGLKLFFNSLQTAFARFGHLAKIINTLFAMALTATLLLAPLHFASASSDMAKGNAAEFIQSLADRALQTLTNQDTPRQQRIGAFRELFDDHFAAHSIGKWVLGRYWSQASEAERKDYMHLFQEQIAISYVDRFNRYSGVRLTVLKMVPRTKERETVRSLIVSNGKSNPIRVDWQVTRSAGKHKITDVVVEAISMSNTMRSEFGSIIRRNGGKVSGLIAALRKKTSVP